MIRVATHGALGERALTQLAAELRDEVAVLPYISIVESYGTRREEVTIELSEHAFRCSGRFKIWFSTRTVRLPVADRQISD